MVLGIHRALLLEALAPRHQGSGLGSNQHSRPRAAVGEHCHHPYSHATAQCLLHHSPAPSHSSPPRCHLQAGGMGLAEACPMGQPPSTSLQDQLSSSVTAGLGLVLMCQPCGGEPQAGDGHSFPLLMAHGIARS